MRFLTEGSGLRRAVVLCLGIGALLACTLSVHPGDSPSATSSAPDTIERVWQAVAPGVEVRQMELPTASILGNGTMIVLRIDPAAATLRVHYSPGAPYALADWAARLPGALAIVNGAFFDEADQALGLLVSDGQAFGASFVGFGGMFQVAGDGARVRALAWEPYQGEALWQAVQAFPMLIDPGGQLAPRGDGFDERSRRSWIGQDRAGRILIGVTPNLISLSDLQDWLLGSGLDLDAAFGLDGGRSSGLLIAAPGVAQTLPALDVLPSVIAVYGS